MLALLRQRNFALLWWGGLVSLTGNRVLSMALPFYVYQHTGSTVATATMILATIVPSMLFSSIAGVFVDRWNRKHVLVITNMILALTLLPLLVVQFTGAVWIIYLVAFVQTTISVFFGLAENALLPLLVAKDQLMPANSLNSLNDSFARLIGPALGGLLLGIWGLESVILFDCCSYLLAGLLVLYVNAPPEQTHASLPSNASLSASTVLSVRNFRNEWQEGVALIRGVPIITTIVTVNGLTTLTGTMMDPLFAPFAYDVLQVSATTFGWILTVQGIGGILAGLLIGQYAKRTNPAYLFSISAIAGGLILLIMFQTVSIPLVFVLSFATGIPNVGSRVGMQTLYQQNVADVYRGRVGGIMTMVGSTLELFSVGFAGIMGEVVGIVPVLLVAANITIFAGVVGLRLFPRSMLNNEYA